MATKLPQELIDEIATLEAESLLDGLKDPDLSKNTAFLAKVRQFLKDNYFITTSETESVQEIKRIGSSIPDLINEGDVIH